MKKKQKSLTKKGRSAPSAETQGSAIRYPECGSEAWKRQEIERMLDNDRYDREQLDKLIAECKDKPLRADDAAALEKRGNPFSPPRMCAIEKIYAFHLKTGKPIRVIGYKLWDVNSGERLKLLTEKRGLVRWAKRRGWTIREDEKCEGCTRPPTTFDSEGVPLCAECAAACDESLPNGGDVPRAGNGAAPKE